MAVIIKKTAAGFEIASPYNADFVAGIKGLTGKWNASSKTWIVPFAVENEARSLLCAIYGEDGTPTERVDLEIEFLCDVEHRGEITFNGASQTIAYARGRDTGGYPAAGIAKISGTLSSGGSRANYTVIARKGLRLRMIGIPRNLADRLITSDNDSTTRVWIEGATIADTTNVVSMRPAQ